MELKLAAKMAKDAIKEMLEADSIQNVAIEEFEYDGVSKEWLITIGFSRPWSENSALASVLTPTRVYKIVRIDDIEMKVVSVKNRIGPA